MVQDTMSNVEAVVVADDASDSAEFNKNLLQILSDEWVEVSFENEDSELWKACYSWWGRSGWCSSSKCRLPS